MIEDALQEIDKSSDLLRTIEQSRQFNKLHLLLFTMCIGVLMAQKSVLSLEEAIEEGDKVAEYEHILRNKIKTQL